MAATGNLKSLRFPWSIYVTRNSLGLFSLTTMSELSVWKTLYQEELRQYLMSIPCEMIFFNYKDVKWSIWNKFKLYSFLCEKWQTIQTVRSLFRLRRHFLTEGELRVYLLGASEAKRWQSSGLLQVASWPLQEQKKNTYAWIHDKSCAAKSLKPLKS